MKKMLRLTWIAPLAIGALLLSPIDALQAAPKKASCGSCGKARDGVKKMDGAAYEKGKKVDSETRKQAQGEAKEANDEWREAKKAGEDVEKPERSWWKFWGE